jgi:hypothetical protein
LLAVLDDPVGRLRFVRVRASATAKRAGAVVESSSSPSLLLLLVLAASIFGKDSEGGVLVLETRGKLTSLSMNDFYSHVQVFDFGWSEGRRNPQTAQTYQPYI